MSWRLCQRTLVARLVAILAAILVATCPAPTMAVGTQAPARRPSTAAPAQSSQPSAQLEFDKAVKLGDQAREAGKFTEAIEQYGKALQLRPKWEDGWWYLGAI